MNTNNFYYKSLKDIKDNFDSRKNDFQENNPNQSYVEELYKIYNSYYYFDFILDKYYPTHQYNNKESQNIILHSPLIKVVKSNSIFTPPQGFHNIISLHEFLKDLINKSFKKYFHSPNSYKEFIKTNITDLDLNYLPNDKGILDGIIEVDIKLIEKAYNHIRSRPNTNHFINIIPSIYNITYLLQRYNNVKEIFTIISEKIMDIKSDSPIVHKIRLETLNELGLLDKFKIADYNLEEISQEISDFFNIEIAEVRKYVLYPKNFTDHKPPLSLSFNNIDQFFNENYIFDKLNKNAFKLYILEKSGFFKSEFYKQLESRENQIYITSILIGCSKRTIRNLEFNKSMEKEFEKYLKLLHS